jgi:hypothetical protein
MRTGTSIHSETYITFWAIYGCAQDGILLMSMLAPQLPAMVLFIVCMLVYDPIAAIAELCNDEVRKSGST